MADQRVPGSATPAYGSLPFSEQVRFFRRKVNLPTAAWTDIYTAEHDFAFVVAGANRDALVADFRAAVDKAVAGGGTLADFRRDFDRIVATQGWDYNGGRAWRSRVIYETNISTSYAAGRLEQLRDSPRTPYWQYEHADWVQQPRVQHLAWDGLVLAADDPWWQQHYPPNGWGCQCQVRGLSLRDLVKLGKAGPDTAPEVQTEERTIGQRSPNGPRTVRVPVGVDPGFEYQPGAARLDQAVPRPRAVPPAPDDADALPARSVPDLMPPPRQLPAQTLPPPGLPDADYGRDLLARLGAAPGRPVVLRDAVGERLVVGESMLGGTAAPLPVPGEQLALLAETLLQPDELWVRLVGLAAGSRAVVRRRYLARLQVQGQRRPVLVVVETGADGWAAVVAADATDADAAAWRTGVRLYQRLDEIDGADQ